MSTKLWIFIGLAIAIGMGVLLFTTKANAKDGKSANANNTNADASGAPIKDSSKPDGEISGDIPAGVMAYIVNSKQIRDNQGAKVRKAYNDGNNAYLGFAGEPIGITTGKVFKSGNYAFAEIKPTNSVFGSDNVYVFNDFISDNNDGSPYQYAEFLENQFGWSNPGTDEEGTYAMAKNFCSNQLDTVEQILKVRFGFKEDLETLFESEYSEDEINKIWTLYKNCQ